MSNFDRTAKKGAEGKRERPQDNVQREPRDADIRNDSKGNDGMLSTEERELILQSQSIQSVLPTPPAIPGFHTCWLSTMNQYDNVSFRQRLGYVPVKHSEVSAMDTYLVHSGEHAGYVSCNEMLLFKISDDGYQQIMKHFHHTRPQEEADRLKANVEGLKDEARDSSGASLIDEEGDGMAEMFKPRRAPKQFE